MEVINGTLLGDGYLTKAIAKGHARLSMTHTATHREWLELKARALDGFTYRVLERAAHGRSKSAVALHTASAVQWVRLRNTWYPKGQKVVPRDLVLTPRLLATWFMDDGSRTASQAVLCTENFGSESLWTLFWKLADLGFKPTVAKHRTTGYRIYLGNGNGGARHESGRRFFEMVAPYIPPRGRDQGNASPRQGAIGLLPRG
jgi:hypothetical protein